MRGQRLKIHLNRLGAHHITARDVMSVSACQTNQCNYLLYLRRAPPSPPIRIEMYFLRARESSAAGEAFNDNAASGERGKEKSPSPQTNTRLLFSAPPRSDIWGKVFAVSSRVSPGSRVLRAPSSVWDKWKTFWLSLQGESARRRGSDCELRWGECEIPATGRVDKKTLIKQFLCYYAAVRNAIFVFGACHLSWG